MPSDRPVVFYTPTTLCTLSTGYLENCTNSPRHLSSGYILPNCHSTVSITFIISSIPNATSLIRRRPRELERLRRDQIEQRRQRKRKSALQQGNMYTQ